jgi:2-polyprenyl-6-methoxyphenol hydroxylase-like FAD-dependent oxidoreductase
MAKLEKTAQCCIAGSGPAGLMLGYLLARGGVRVLVLEKHADFLRDFRGDTIHPSTLEVMHELGLLGRFLELPHQKVARLTGQFGDTRFELADFSHLPVHCRYIAMMPQWDFLNFLAEEGKRYPSFDLMMEAEANDLIDDGKSVVGVEASTPDGPLTVKADLVVGADGRGSVLRARSGLDVETIGAPMDALWFRLSRHPADGEQTLGRFEPGRIFVMLNRGDYWQCAFVIAKGTLEVLQARGLPAFRETVASMATFARARTEEIKSWDDVKLLSVRVDRLTKWYRSGLLFIGDAAHAMSPVGGVGINLAVQDAVAAANILAVPLLNGAVGEGTLEAVQKRRSFPTRVTQALQVVIQNNVIAPALAEQKDLKPPLLMRWMARWPLLRRIPARLIGLGVRPEHVASFIRARDGAA